MSDNLTPMMRQYLEIKKECEGAILFFRLGDFYEMFFEDAVEASRILHITLTSRGQHKGVKVPMCGVPHHAAENYIARLIKSGKKVAVCEQIEEAAEEGKKIFGRRIARIVTPGTFIAEGFSTEASNSYIMSLNFNSCGFGIAYADISTGEFRLTEVDSTERLFPEIYKICPAETIIPKSFRDSAEMKEIREAGLGTITIREDWTFNSLTAEEELRRQFEVKTLESFGCSAMGSGIGAAGALLRYLKDTQKNSLGNVRSMRVYNVTEYMTLDRVSHRHLELVENQEDLTSSGTLYEVLDKTKTPMGKRELKRWLLNPLLDTVKISERLDAVEFFHDNNQVRVDTREILDGMYDIERLANKVALGTANPRDMLSLADSLEKVGMMVKLSKEKFPGSLADMASGMEDFFSVIADIRSCLREDPSTALKEGGIIKDGYDQGVDELRKLVSSGRDWLVDFQVNEAKRTGINSLKVGYNRVFGYYIEITNSNLPSVPADYIRKQTLANAERFVTQGLKEQEDRILGAEERIKNLEYEIFVRLRERVAGGIENVRQASESASKIDVIAALAETAFNNRYVRPKVTSSGVMSIKEGRHPVLERILKGKEFVSNDCFMDTDEERVFIITGSNMAGKSTFIRQVALITIMAQMGSFVPASSAEIGIVDRIFTRVGASDRLYQGMSTFMVEMIETANILNSATERSLIVLDEVGRGTSTFDGVSIAWAVVEYIHGELKGAKAMFATHYHELTELSEVMRGVVNYHLAVQEWEDQIIFLYKVQKGSCDESFGIHVAKLAGLPEAVVKRAREILANLHRDSFAGNVRSRFIEKIPGSEKQLDFFGEKSLSSGIAERIMDMDTDRMTPMEALQAIAEIKKELSSGATAQKITGDKK